MGPGLIGLGVEPSFGIGPRALLVRTAQGNVLWDCVPLLDGALVETVGAPGGLAAIAVSHPHDYAAMVDWSRAFGGVPIQLRAADRRRVMRPGPSDNWGQSRSSCRVWTGIGPDAG